MRSSAAPQQADKSPSRSAGAGSFFQPKLSINEPGDGYEQEADAVADQVMRLPGEKTDLFFKPVVHTLQRKCAHCEEEEEHHLQRSESGSAPSEAEAALENYVGSLPGAAGQPMPKKTEAFFGSRMNADFSDVRIHTGTAAAASAQSINALAYTSGKNIVFNHNQYAPETDKGKRLLAHELTHVIQQGNQHQIQRTTNGSNTPRTPTNCHNWAIPLPPWIAGIAAHSQIAAFASGAGITPHMIPRAIKLLRGIPAPPFGTPPGFADLWWNSGADVRIAEIKSTASGDAAAHPEARHYRDRHNEWLARLATRPLALDDSNYLASVGLPIPGALLDLSGFTGGGISLGPFRADPLKQLHIEADSNGAVVYWCTGIGLINPVGGFVLRDLLDSLKDLLDQLKRLAQRIGGIIDDALGWLGDNAPALLVILLVIAMLALIVLAIICAIGAAETFGLTLACSYFAVIAAVEAAASILILLGISSGGELRQAGAELARLSATPDEESTLASGEAYERNTDGPVQTSSTGGSVAGTSNPTQRLRSALSPILSFDGVLAIARSMTNPPAGARSELNRALAILDTAGDTGTAAIIRSGLERTT